MSGAKAGHAAAAAVSPRVMVKSMLPLFPAPGGPRTMAPRPALNGVTEFTETSSASRLPMKFPNPKFVVIRLVQRSNAFTAKNMPVRYCVSKGTCSGSSCDPLAPNSRKRPKRGTFPVENGLPFPGVACPNLAGFVGYATPSASMTLISRAMSALKGATGASRSKTNPPPSRKSVSPCRCHGRRSPDRVRRYR